MAAAAAAAIVGGLYFSEYNIPKYMDIHNSYIEFCDGMMADEGDWEVEVSRRPSVESREHIC